MSLMCLSEQWYIYGGITISHHLLTHTPVFLYFVVFCHFVGVPRSLLLQCRGDDLLGAERAQQYRG
jgi:hypothetical protein